MRYIYFGTSEFAATILERLISAQMVPIAVVTQPDRPAGRGKELQEPPVKTVAEKYEILLLQPQKISPLDSAQGRDFRFQISDLRPDLCIVAAYGGIIPKEILDIPKHGFVNVHPSLLPKYRGPSPIQTAILNGDMETGVTLILLDEEIDHGDIISDFRFQISDLITAPELEKELASIGAELLIKTIPDWVAGKITPKSQDHAKATFTKILTKEDGHIDWTKSAEEIERHIRAMTPWPGSWTVWRDGGKEMRLSVKGVAVETSPPPLLEGEGIAKSGKVLEISDDALIVACREGQLAISSLQPEGKKEMTARDFANGHKEIVGAALR